MRPERSRAAILTLVTMQPQTPGDDVAGHVGEPTVLNISVCPEPGKRLSSADAELYREHAGGLVNLGAVQCQAWRLPVHSRLAC